MIVPVGSIVNALAIIFGGLIGMLARKSLPDRIKTIIFQAIGLCTLLMGVSMGLKVEDFLTLIFSMILGGILGELLHVDHRMNAFSDWLKVKLNSKQEGFTEGLVTAFLIFCIGSMTFVGALNEGISGDRSLIFTKSILDFFTSIVLASVYGVGVLFSAIPLFIIQASLTLLAVQFSGVFTDVIVNQMTAVGGVLILGIGLNMLEIKKINTMNLLPALLFIIALTVAFL